MKIKMGISIKDIENRKYDSESKETISFEYTIKGLEGSHGEPQEMRVWFEKVNPQTYGMQTTNPTYKVFTFIDTVVYEKIFAMPKSGMSLMMVVATGLNLLRRTFFEEAEYKEMIAYIIADITKDM